MAKQSDKPHTLKYEQPLLMSHSELEQELASGNGERIANALLSAFYSENPEWVQKSCLRFAAHPDNQVRRNVAVVLGNVSHVYASEIDLNVSLETLQKLNTDNDASVRVASEDAIEGVLHMMGRLKKKQ